MPEMFLIHDRDHTSLNARFFLETVDGELTLVFEAPRRASPHSDYDEALGLVFERLGQAGATLMRVLVDTGASRRDYSPQERVINLGDRPYPIELDGARDTTDLHLRLGAEATKTAQAHSPADNAERRLRFWLLLSGASVLSESELADIVSNGLLYDTESASTGSASESSPITIRGRGLERDGRVRAVLERYALDAAVAHYQEGGWRVTRAKGERLGHDLVCTQGDERVWVKVKATRGPGQRLNLSANELNYVLTRRGRTDLFICSNIQIKRVSDRVRAYGGSTRAITAWDPSVEGELEAKEYWYTLPTRS